MEIVVFRSSDIQTRSALMFFFGSKISPLGDKRKGAVKASMDSLGKF
jgi:hypothetical protein